MKRFLPIFLTALLLTACESQVREENEETIPEETENNLPEGYLRHESKTGLSFTYPSTWSVVEDATTVRIYNEVEATDNCSTAQIQLAFAGPQEKSAELSFEDFVNTERYKLDGGMGKLGGTLSQTTVAGQMTYKAEMSGWESMCEDEAYLVEIDEDTYWEIAVFYNAEQTSLTEVEKLLDSVSF